MLLQGRKGQGMRLIDADALMREFAEFIMMRLGTKIVLMGVSE